MPWQYFHFLPFVLSMNALVDQLHYPKPTWLDW